jgi:hypothetical protein
MPGNALHRMFAFIHPHVKHVVTASVDAVADESNAGALRFPDDPIIHIHRQAVRISQGKPVDYVTALLSDELDRGKENGLPRSQKP